MRYRLFLLIWVLFSTPVASTWGQERCSTTEVLEYNISRFPEIIQAWAKIEEHTRQHISGSGYRSTVVITIPVVVHILYNTVAENISTAQIESQLQVLNDDFRRTNSDANNNWPQAADTEIEFRLATIDPAGNPTCGITRTQTYVSEFEITGDPMKFDETGGKDAWPYTDYLNIWVCDLKNNLLGFAQFPEGGAPETDGIVVDYEYFGTIGTADNFPYDKGRTATHEVGHWLNLRHIWGNGDCIVDDFVDDTPLCNGPYNFSVCGSKTTCGSKDMIENYMDYSPDRCMNLFTQGQKSRMRAQFEPGGFREGILFSRGSYTGPPSTPFTLNLIFDAAPQDVSWQVANGSGQIVANGSNYGSTWSGSELVETFYLEDGAFTFSIFDASGNGGTSFQITSLGETVNIVSNGNYSGSKSVFFNCFERVYIFKGPGTSWNTGSNWNKGHVPSACFTGNIEIQSNCIIPSSNIFTSSQNQIKIMNGATLTRG